MSRSESWRFLAEFRVSVSSGPTPGCPREATRRTSPRGPAPRRFQRRAPSPRPGDSAGVSRRAGRRGPGPLRDQRNTSLLTVAGPRVQGPVPGERGPEVGWGRAQAQEVWPLLETTADERRRQDPPTPLLRRRRRRDASRNAAHTPDRTLGPLRCVTGPARQRSPQGAKGPAGWGVRRPPHCRAPEGQRPRGSDGSQTPQVQTARLSAVPAFAERRAECQL